MKNKLTKIKNNNSGFTLVELIVVIAIIGILAAVMLPKFAGFSDKARMKSAVADAKNIYTASSTIYGETGSYPTTANKDTVLAKYVQIGSDVTLTFEDAPATKLFTYDKNYGGKHFKVECSVNGEIKELEPADAATPAPAKTNP